ncbi:MAG TPA: DUF4097 family beta strand repeat-containing protein [Longimicrobiaceae bacterium]|nr:DUF4097 family beta strand repeat-containing protein [Longimicrobiaceae bacterium]
MIRLRARSLPAPAVLAAALLALAASPPSPAAAQRDDAEWLERCREQRGSRWGQDRARFCEVRTERLRPTGSLVVDGGENGGASVRGWDGNEIRVSARIQTHAPTEAEARELARQIRVSTSGGNIRATGPERRRGAGWTVVYEIRVPRRQDVSVTTQNGPVAVEDVRGRMTLRAANGPVSLRRVGGAVNARVRNGPLSVVLDGDRWNGEGLDAETVNGPVRLTLPADYSAQLEVGTVNGPANIDLPLSEGYRSGRHIRTTLGSGGAPVRVVTTNGPVAVRRGES